MLTKKTLSFLLVALGLAGVVAFRRWNRELEAAVALPRYAEGGLVHPSVPGSLTRHIVVRLGDHHGTFEPHVPPMMRKIPPRYWS